MSRPGALAAAALTVATPTSAWAHGVEHTPSGATVHWTSFPVGYRVDLEDAAKTDRRWILRTIRRGPEAWTLPSKSAAAFHYDGPTKAGLVQGDGVNAITFVTHGWPADLGDPGVTAAATLLTYDDATGVLSEADVGVNDAGFRFASETPKANALDLWSISAHEAGHVLGLAHDCGSTGQPACTGAPPSITGAIMFPAAVPGDTSRRVPNADDLAGLASLYGPGSVAPPDGHLAPRACAADPLIFVPTAASATPTDFEIVDADSGIVSPISFSAEIDGDHLAAVASPGHVLDLVVEGASGKDRALYDAIVPVAPCGGDGGTTTPKTAGCGCSATAGSPAGPILLVLGLAVLGRRRR